MIHNIYEKDTYGWWCARIKDPKWREKAFNHCRNKLSMKVPETYVGDDNNSYVSFYDIGLSSETDAIKLEFKTSSISALRTMFFLPKPYYEMESSLIGKQYAGKASRFYTHFNNKWEVIPGRFAKEDNWKVIEELEIDEQDCVKLQNGTYVNSILKSDFFSTNKIKEEQSTEIPEWFNEFKEGDKFYNKNGFPSIIKNKRIEWSNGCFINPYCKLGLKNILLDNQLGFNIMCGSNKHFVPYSELHKFKLHKDCLKRKNINKQPIITSKNNNDYETTSKAVKVSPITPTISGGQEITGTPVCGRKSKVAVASANLSYSAVSC